MGSVYDELIVNVLDVARVASDSPERTRKVRLVIGSVRWHA
jgi:hypothetical protein